MAQGNLSTGDPPLHRHIPDFGLRGFENDFGPPHWPANNKQCHSEVLAQWFLALQKSSPWKGICLFSLSWNGQSLEPREGITQGYLIGPSFLKNSDPKSHWRDTYRIIPNFLPSDHFTLSMLPLLLIFKWKHLWYYAPSHAKNAQEITISWKGFAKNMK